MLKRKFEEDLTTIQINIKKIKLEEDHNIKKRKLEEDHNIKNKKKYDDKANLDYVTYKRTILMYL